MTSVTSRKKYPSYKTVKNWVARFKIGNFGKEGMRPFRNVTGDKCAVHNLILADPRISARKTAQTRDISGRCQNVIVSEIPSLK
jgi:hypothetical protein